MKELSDVTFLVFGHGLEIPIAARLARDSKRVLYHSPWEEGFSTINKGILGEGIVERCDDIWAVKNEVDCFVFPDVQHSGLQLELESQGYPVWGARRCDRYELNREFFMKALKNLGLDVPKFEVYVGITKLREALREKENCYVKISKYRGSLETHHWRSWKLDENWLDLLAVRFGAVREHAHFLLFDAIDTPLEIGGDTFCVDGQWPKLMLHGIENKDCYDSQTEVMTEEGWKFFKELEGSERFLTLNLHDSVHSKLEYQTASDYICDNYSGKMLSVESDNISLLVTPNHKLLVQVNGQDKTKERITWKGIDGIRRTFHQGKHNRKLVAAKDLDLTKWFSMPWPRGAFYWGELGLNRFRFGDIVIGKSNFAEFLGIYLSEGWTDGQKIVIGQEKYCAAVENIIKRCGLRYHVFGKRTGKIKGFGISNVPLAKYLAQFGKSADKHAPLWLKRSGWRTVRRFIAAYCLGDGSCKRCYKQSRGNKTERISRVFFTISKGMADDLQELIAKCGRQSIVGVARCSTTGKLRYIISEHEVQDKNYVTRKHTRWVDYDGMIYCVTVPNHIILVRRNGKACWCGNSSYLAAVTSFENMPEPLKLIMTVFAPRFEKGRYRNEFSMEVRVLDEKAYFIDPTTRLGLPSTGSQLELWKNFSQIVWAGANGELVEPEPAGKFSAELILTAKADDGLWPTVEVPKELKRWCKLADCIEVDGLTSWPREGGDDQSVGWLVAIGDTPRETLETIKGYVAALPEGLSADIAPLADVIKEIEIEENEGLDFTEQQMPAPAAVIT